MILAVSREAEIPVLPHHASVLFDYLVFLLSPFPVGLLYSQIATKKSQPVTVAPMPEIQGQAPLIA